MYLKTGQSAKDFQLSDLLLKSPANFIAQLVSKVKLPLSPFLKQTPPTEAALLINTASAAAASFQQQTTASKHLWIFKK